MKKKVFYTKYRNFAEWKRVRQKRTSPAGMRGTVSGARNRDGFGCVLKIDGRIQHGFDDARPYGEIAETFVGIASRRPFADQVV